MTSILHASLVQGRKVFKEIKLFESLEYLGKSFLERSVAIIATEPEEFAYKKRTTAINNDIDFCVIF